MRQLLADEQWVSILKTKSALIMMVPQAADNDEVLAQGIAWCAASLEGVLAAATDDPHLRCTRLLSQASLLKKAHPQGDHNEEIRAVLEQAREGAFTEKLCSTIDRMLEELK